MQVIAVNNVPLFFSQRDDVWFPTLRLLHQYPDMMPKLRADTGAIKFVLSGANIMCPGLTSAGATIHDEVISTFPPLCNVQAVLCAAQHSQTYKNINTCHISLQ